MKRRGARQLGARGLGARGLGARPLASRPSWALLLAALAASLIAVSLVGCGDDDSVVKSGGAGASTAGGAGKGGGASKGGSGGEAGGNEAGALFGCDGESAFQPNPQIVRSCLLRAGCDPTFAPVRTVSTCVTYNTQAALSGESCNLSSTSCADFEACEHVGIAHDDLCGAQTEGTRCQGNLAINCGNYQGDDRFYDCAALGGSCGTLTIDGKRFADCQLDIAPDSCAGLASSDTKNYCHSGGAKSDDLRYYCWQGQAFGASCSSHASCIDTPDGPDGSAGAGAGAGGAAGASSVGNANCFYDTDSCQGADSVSCNGNVATVCSSGSQFKYDCGSVGLSCSVTSHSEYCLAPGCNAADVDFVCQESCSDDGSSLTFCYGGLPYTVSCADYGFSQCRTGTDADSGRTFAACRF